MKKQSKIQKQAIEMVAQVRAMRDQVKAIESQKKAIEDALKDALQAMGVNEGVFGDFKVKIAQRQRTNIDSKLLAEQYPDVFASTAKLVEYEVLDIR